MIDRILINAMEKINMELFYIKNIDWDYPYTTGSVILPHKKIRTFIK